MVVFTPYYIYAYKKAFAKRLKVAGEIAKEESIVSSSQIADKLQLITLSVTVPTFNNSA